MPLDLNGFDVLKRISAHPDVFMDIKAEVNKAARLLVSKQLKAKTIDLDSLRLVAKTIEDDAFSLVVDGLSDAEAKSVLGKIDKHHPKLKGLDAAWRRGHLRDLASGRAELTEPPAKKRKGTTGKSKTRTEPARLNSAAMAARRRRE